MNNNSNNNIDSTTNRENLNTNRENLNINSTFNNRNDDIENEIIVYNRDVNIRNNLNSEQENNTDIINNEINSERNYNMIYSNPSRYNINYNNQNAESNINEYYNVLDYLRESWNSPIYVNNRRNIYDDIYENYNSFLSEFNTTQRETQTQYDRIFNEILDRSFNGDIDTYREVLSEEGKKQIRYEKYKSNNGYNTSCPILITDFEEDEDIAILPCGHCFSPDAINKWLEEKKSECPVCRYKLKSREVRNEQEIGDVSFNVIFDTIERNINDITNTPNTTNTPTTPISSSIQTDISNTHLLNLISTMPIRYSVTTYYINNNRNVNNRNINDSSSNNINLNIDSSSNLINNRRVGYPYPIRTSYNRLRNSRFFSSRIRERSQRYRRSIIEREILNNFNNNNNSMSEEDRNNIINVMNIIDIDNSIIQDILFNI
jgi:hypothetical protein